MKTAFWLVSVGTILLTVVSLELIQIYGSAIRPQYKADPVNKEF